MIKLLLPIYDLIWRVARPFLQHSPRLRSGWSQRTLQEVADGPFDLWIQAASGGESLLTNMILDQLEALVPKDRQWRALVTSGTKQGVDSLDKGRQNRPRQSSLAVTVAYFPFDAPRCMAGAFTRFRPKLAVLVETELWPGFLITARRNRVPVLLVNGRMSEKSFRSYRYFGGFLKRYGPSRVLAISPTDGERFSRLIGTDRVRLMNNIKFDRIAPSSEPAKSNPIVSLVPADSPFLLFGSVRREEEVKIETAIATILAARPEVTIGLFPKHIERADPWLNLLAKRQIAAVRRSAATGRQKPGTVIVWDVFGELAGAYALARAAFVGGSLLNLGGQNFLEPLVFGLRPIIGPFWKNFAWVGREIVASGLVEEVADENELVDRMQRAIETRVARDEVVRQVEDFFAPRRGGTRQVCQQIIDTMNVLETR